MKHCFFTLVLLLMTPFASAKTTISPGDPCIDIDGCECIYPINIDVVHRYVNKKESVECKFTSLCYENAAGVNCQDSDAADIECDSVNSCPTSLVGNFEDVFPEEKYTRHFIVVGKNKYVNQVGLLELNPRLDMKASTFVTNLVTRKSGDKPENKNQTFECPKEGNDIDGCILSWGVIDKESIIARNKRLKSISDAQRKSMIEINGEIVIPDPEDKSKYTLPELVEQNIPEVLVHHIEINHSEGSERLKNMNIEFKYRFGIFIPKGARASLSDGMIELDYDDGEFWECPRGPRKTIDELMKEKKEALENDPILKGNNELQTALITKYAKLYDRVCLCNASLDICPNSKEKTNDEKNPQQQFCHFLGPEPYCHFKEVETKMNNEECKDFYGCRCASDQKRDSKTSVTDLLGVYMKKKKDRIISGLKNMVTTTKDSNGKEEVAVKETAKQDGGIMKLEDLSNEVRDRRKYDIIRKNFICGDDRYNQRESERECADEFCYCSELERAKKDTKCASAIKDNENRLKIGDACKSENGCFCYNIGMIGVTCAKNEICEGPNLIANFVMNSLVMTAQKKIPFASLDIPKLQVMTCRRDKNAQKFWKCTNDRGCFCGYSALACKKDMFCRLSKAKNMCMEKETTAAFEFRNTLKSFRQKIAKTFYEGLSKRIKDDNGKEIETGSSKVVL